VSEPLSSVAPGVTVVIPCRNGEATIDAQLGALADQDFDGEMEVIVVDNESTDGSADRARAWCTRVPNLRVVEATRPHNVAHARNVGIEAASHEVVLVCDADDVVDGAWVRQLASTMTRADVAGGGIVDWIDSELPVGLRPRPFGRGGFGFLPTIPGCNFGVCRTAWRALGGFDETLASCEDIDFGWRAELAGYRVTGAVDAFVYHRVARRPADVFRKWRFYGEYQPSLYARFRDQGLTRQSIHRALGGWVVLLLTSYRLATGTVAKRREWCADAGRRVGRVIGSVRFGTLYL